MHDLPKSLRKLKGDGPGVPKNNRKIHNNEYGWLKSIVSLADGQRTVPVDSASQQTEGLRSLLWVSQSAG